MSDMDQRTMLELSERLEGFFEELPPLLAGVEGMVERGKAYRKALYDAGLAGLEVPSEYSGGGYGPTSKALFARLSRGRVPAEDDIFTIGLGMAMPTLLEFGDEHLRRRYVEPALRGEEIWCQMYSEPGAGSDLAGLQTRALRTPGGWVLNGQKIWTSRAEVAQFAICLARTDVDVPKHKGITMFVVPMDQAGVKVRPIRQITGACEFNEVFLDDVLVPADHVVGEVDGGWPVAVALMQNERSAIGAGGGRRPVPFESLRDLVHDRDCAAEPRIREALADCYIGQRLSELLTELEADSVDAGVPLGAETSLGKLWRSTNGRAAADLVSELAFASGAAWKPGDDRENWAFAVLDSCALSLGGGTDEVQKNTIAEKVLGLPRDPYRTDKMPFRDLTVGTQRD
ncbi:acyl-CoA dehydrogenase family protein [Saccharopolyspora shandongensis]|uniref:acyl-CoA dehydrogenase family protein n=1 Tax=Saccharopolyspora shandongensis TaxID=418495 RepID=UPI0033F3D59E